MKETEYLFVSVTPNSKYRSISNNNVMAYKTNNRF